MNYREERCGTFSHRDASLETTLHLCSCGHDEERVECSICGRAAGPEWDETWAGLPDN